MILGIVADSNVSPPEMKEISKTLLPLVSLKPLLFESLYLTPGGRFSVRYQVSSS